jgi:hypothetical protein
MNRIFSVDWAHKTENVRVYNGKKTSDKLPDPASDITIATENMPLRQCKPFLDAGASIYRTTTHQTRKYRDELGIEKNHAHPAHDEDAKIIYELYEAQPDQFYKMTWNPIFSEFRALYALFKEIQKVRIANGNRSWANPDSELLQANVDNLKSQEETILKEIENKLETMPIWTNFLSNVIGVGVATAAGLLAYVGDIARFPNVSCMMKYFGLDVQNGKAPRKQVGKSAMWHHEGRALILGVIADLFIKAKGGDYTNKTGKIIRRRKCPYRSIYELEKAKQLEMVDKPIIAEKRARRKMMKEFIKDFYKAYKAS